MTIVTQKHGNGCNQLYEQALGLEFLTSQPHLYRTGVNRGNAQNFGDR